MARFNPNVSAWTRALVLAALVSSGTAAPADHDTPPGPNRQVAPQNSAATQSGAEDSAATWLYAKVGQIDVLSSASPKKTKRFIDDFYAFQSALGIVAPSLALNLESPSIVIVSGDGDERNGFMARLPQGISRRASIALIDKPDGPILIVNPSGATAPGGNSRESDFEFSESVRRGYVRLLVQRLEPQPPSWFTEGIVQLLAQIKYNSRSVDFADLTPFLQPGPDGLINRRVIAPVGNRSGSPSGFSGYRGQNGYSPARQALESTGKAGASPVHYLPMELMPQERFFRLAEYEAESSSQLSAALVERGTRSRQSLLFVHYGLFGNDQRHRAAFLQLVADASQQPVTEESIKKYFGFSYEEMDAELNSYFGKWNHGRERFEPAEGESFTHVPAYAFRNATPAESARITNEAIHQAEKIISARKAPPPATRFSPFPQPLVSPKAATTTVGASAVFAGDYYESRDVERKPTTSEKLQISHSGLAKDSSIPVAVAFLITPKGRATQIQIRSEVAPDVATAVTHLLEQIVFSPGLKNGAPVTTAVVRVVTVRSSL